MLCRLGKDTHRDRGRLALRSNVVALNGTARNGPVSYILYFATKNVSLTYASLVRNRHLYASGLFRKSPGYKQYIGVSPKPEVQLQSAQDYYYLKGSGH